jgi:multidrug efflux pump
MARATSCSAWRRRKAPTGAACAPTARRTRRSSTRHRPREGQRARGSPVADINDTLSTPGAAATSTTSSTAAASRRSTCRRMPPSACSPRTSSKWYVRNSAGPDGAVLGLRQHALDYGSPRLERYNGVPAMEIQGQPAPGVSSGDAMAAIERMAWRTAAAGHRLRMDRRLLPGAQAGSQAPALYALSLLVVFLCLAALYESWSIPFACMLVVPLGMLGAVLAAPGSRAGTTSTSRSACSPPSACRRRTRS